MKASIAAAVLGLALSTAAVSPSFAHTQPMMESMGGPCPMMHMMGQGMMGQGMMGQGMMDQGMMDQGMMNQGAMAWHPNMDALAIGRLAYLEAELGITDSQMVAWDRYAEAVKGNMATMQGMHQNMMMTMGDGTMIDRLDARIGGMEAMVEAMKAMKPAAEELYAVLDDDQRQKADILIGMSCGAM